jgi:hypothetical protein
MSVFFSKDNFKVLNGFLKELIGDIYLHLTSTGCHHMFTKTINEEKIKHWLQY